MKKRIGSWFTWITIGMSILAIGGLASRAEARPSGQPAAWEAAVRSDGVDDGPGVMVSAHEETSAIRSTQTLSPTVYLPVVAKRYFKAYTYQDNFEDWDSGWPYGTEPFSYGYKQDKDGSRVYHIRVEDEYQLAFVTGPQEAYALGDFEYEVWMRRGAELPKYWYDEYGILISPAPIDPAKRSGSNVYTFQIKLRIADDRDSLYSVSRWSALNRSSRSVLVEVEEGDYISDEAKIWNQFRIARVGDTLQFYLTRQGKGDWKHVYSTTDSTLPDQLYIGFYAMHSKDDLGAYTIEFQFDNVWLSAHP